MCGDSQVKTFDTLIQSLITELILVYLDFAKPFKLDIDACRFSLGAVLSQIGDDNKEHPVAYYSCVLTDLKCKYAAIKKECLAMVDGIRHFRPYLWGKQFTVVVDHRVLL